MSEIGEASFLSQSMRVAKDKAFDIITSLQGQKLGKLVLDPGAAKDFERPFKSYLKSEDQDEQSSSKNQAAFKPPSSDSSHNPFVNRPDSEEMQKP